MTLILFLLAGFCLLYVILFGDEDDTRNP